MSRKRFVDPDTQAPREFIVYERAREAVWEIKQSRDKTIARLEEYLARDGEDAMFEESARTYVEQELARLKGASSKPQLRVVRPDDFVLDV